MKILDRLNGISPERLAAGGSSVDIYEASKKAVEVGGAATALGLAADAVGFRWGTALALAGICVECGGGSLMVVESDQLRAESETSTVSTQ